MKRISTIIVGLALALSAMAEATFDQIEGLIQQKQYAAAEAGLEVIIQNHPKSAKAFYAMAQAQAGMGNLEKANKALNIATGLNPTLDFAPSSSVASLKQAITPQTAKIEAVEESHAFRNFVLFVMFAGFAVAMYFLYSVYARKQEEEEAARKAEYDAAEAKVKRMQAAREAEEAAQAAKELAEHNAKQDALKAHPNYGHERFDPANPDKLKSVKQFKEEQLAQAMVAKARAEAEAAEARRAQLHAENLYRSQPTAPTTTVVNNSGNDMLTGIMIGNMMSGSHHDHDTTVIRETVREVPAKAPRSSWDDIDSTPAPSKSSSWDDTPSRSSSRSSSWDDDSSSSSSSRSSSWSSSSDSSSSSSWSDSSSSSSDSGSSSSWD